MTLDQLFAEILISLKKAQYESNRFSQELSENNFGGFPVPVAEMKEVSLDVAFVYRDYTENTSEGRYDIPQIYNRISDSVSEMFHECEKILGNRTGTEENPKKREEGTAIADGAFPMELVEHIREDLLRLIDSKLHSDDSGEGLRLSLIDFFRSVVRDFIKSRIDAPRQELKGVNDVLLKGVNQIYSLIAEQIRPVIAERRIMVDVCDLKNLSGEVIQRAKVKVKLRNRLIE